MAGVRSPIPGVVYMEPEEVAKYLRLGAFAEQTIASALRQTFVRNAARIALSTPSQLVTYAELDTITDRAAAALWRLGLRPYDRVLFQMRNCPELVYAFVACLKIGVIPVCTLAAHREKEIGYIGQHADAKAHFVHGDDPRFDLVEFATRMAQDAGSKRAVIVARGEPRKPGAQSFEQLIAEEGADNGRELAYGVQLDPYQAAIFQLSGGTSGVPKIIPRFNMEYLHAMRSVIDFIGLSNESVTFTPNPFMHNAPMACFWGATLLAGGEVVIAEGPSIASIEAALAARRPNWIAMAKVHLMKLVESGGLERLNFDNVRAFSVPDSALALSRQFGAPFVPMYGMTEGLLAFCQPGDPEEAIAQTVGRSTTPHDEIRIVSPDTEEDLPEGEVGELLVRGPCTIRGYFNAPERDVEAFTADGFYRSGDLMSFHTVEGRRNLVFKGRVKDVIDRGGEKINCSEVEAVIDSHPAVGAVACVAMPDPLYGERMCAFIVLRQDAPALELGALSGHLREVGLAKFKWPERIEIVDELPTTSSGKVSKPLMREIIARKVRSEAEAKAAG